MWLFYIFGGFGLRFWYIKKLSPEAQAKIEEEQGNGDNDNHDKYSACRNCTDMYDTERNRKGGGKVSSKTNNATSLAETGASDTELPQESGKAQRKTKTLKTYMKMRRVRLRTLKSFPICDPIVCLKVSTISRAQFHYRENISDDAGAKEIRSNAASAAQLANL